MNEDQAAEFEDRSRQEISAEQFRHDSDRQVALGILQGFRAKQVLADAISHKDLETIRNQLDGLRDRSLAPTLDEPVEDLLNALLHVAVRAMCPDAVP